MIPDRNTPGKKDYTGAFLPEARAFAKLHGGVITAINVTHSPARKRRAVLDVIHEAGNGVDLRVVFFCHGLRSGLPQLGFARPHAAELAAVVAKSRESMLRAAPRVILYACSTGGGPHAGDGGFADLLRDELCKAGASFCTVDAHDRPGHTTRLPYVRRFEGRGSPVGGMGGSWIVAPGSELWAKWRARLQGNGDFRFRFPMMATGDIHRALLA